MVEHDYTTFKTRIRGQDWGTTEWKPFADVTPELMKANCRAVQEEARNLLPVINATPAPKTPVVLHLAKSVADEF